MHCIGMVTVPDSSKFLGHPWTSEVNCPNRPILGSMQNAWVQFLEGFRRWNGAFLYFSKCLSRHLRWNIKSKIPCSLGNKNPYQLSSITWPLAAALFNRKGTQRVFHRPRTGSKCAKRIQPARDVVIGYHVLLSYSTNGEQMTDSEVLGYTGPNDSCRNGVTKGPVHR